MVTTISNSTDNLDAKKHFPVLKTLKNGLTNYGEWSIKAKSQPQRLDLWEIIEGEPQ